MNRRVSPRLRAAFVRWGSNLFRGFQDFVAPFYCAICDGDSEGTPFCRDCRRELLKGANDPACPRCASAVGPHAFLSGGCSECRGRSLGFQGAVALAPYEGPIRDLCLRMKHESERRLAKYLVDLLVDVKEEAIRTAAGSDPIVTPIPLHWLRRLQRGYNQAESLAEHLANRLRFPFRPRVLQRVRSSEALAGASRAERIRRMKEAFRFRSSKDLKGKTILLVDDILTTGATCGAAGRVLKQAGVAKTVAVVIGRAGRR